MDLGRDLREGTAKSEEEVVGKQDRKSALRPLRNLLSDKEEKVAGRGRWKGSYHVATTGLNITASDWDTGEEGARPCQ